jgi:hypothetical protein
MSYNIAVLSGSIDNRDAIAWQGIDGILAMTGEPSSELRSFYDRITARYPCLSTLDEAELDSDKAAWSDGSLLNNFGPVGALLPIRGSRAEVVLPFVIDTARAFGLFAFDWSTHLIHRPDGLPGLVLTLEGRPILNVPSLSQIIDGVDSLTPRGGPGFMDITGPDRDYLQIAGGDGQFTCEWRRHEGASFQHWVAGLPGNTLHNDVQIQTNGFHITVKQHERLGVTNVKELVRFFIAASGLPSSYTWRDITQTFR